MIHLHVHSNFSFLDGASPPDRLLQRAAELGMPALALTDHHGLYGAVRFIHAARALNVKPIVGVEICILEDDASAHSPPTGSRGLSALSRSSRKQGWGERRPHLV